MSGRNQARIREWLTGKALPLWSTAGADGIYGFAEQLHLDGAPNLAVPKRVRVQARQIYVYSHAAVLGLWPQGAETALRGYEFLRAHAWPDGAKNGVVHTLARKGGALDVKRDTYDHAFVLMGLAWLYRATKDDSVREAADAIAGFVDRRLRHAGGHGYVEDDAATLPRGQNCHMHLFEAFLALFEATGDEKYLARAGELKHLFTDKLFDRERSVLREFYTEDWRPAPGEAGDAVWPGHHFEWIWLLHKYARAAEKPVPAEVAPLYDWATAHGTESASALALFECDPGGTARIFSKRCWCQTEAVKAELALGAARGMPISPRADAFVDALFRYYLDPALPGGWNDVVDASNRPISDHMPASTFYHIFLAFAEYHGAATTRAR